MEKKSNKHTVVKEPRRTKLQEVRKIILTIYRKPINSESDVE